MPTPLDFAFVFVLLVVGSLFEHLVFWPRFRAEIDSGVPGARARAYRRGIVGQWLFTVAAVVIWTAYARSAGALRLAPPTGWRLWTSLAVVIAVAVLAFVQLRFVAPLSPAQRIAARPKLGGVAFILPHSRSEHRWFLALSATAGICEELLYRGYLVWFLTPWIGVNWAFGAVVALFGIGHLYQGRRGAIRATLAGAVMAGVVMLTGWLVPAMIIHALVDASSGTVGYWLLREPDDDRNATLEHPPAAQLAAG